MVKRCSKCWEEKPKCEFYKSSSTYDGLQSYCKDCNRGYLRNYMNKKYEEPKYYELQLMRNSLSRWNTLGILKDFLGCSIKYFNDWLEFQRIGKTIENEELDHVLPVAHFIDRPDLCWWWVNIRPISKIENREKRDKVDIALFYEQLNKAIEFFGQYHFPNMQEMEEVSNNWNERVGKYFIDQNGHQHY